MLELVKDWVIVVQELKELGIFWYSDELGRIGRQLVLSMRRIVDFIDSISSRGI